MKTIWKIVIFTILLVIGFGGYFIYQTNEKKQTKTFVKREELVTEVAALEVNEYEKEPIVYDGLTMTELAEKLDRSLNSSISGYGYLYASYCLEKGVDPYMAVAITLHETGCKWECSYLTSACNNVGGQKGSPSCGGGSYMRYDTMEEGIKGYIDNLYDGYISRGLTTPETIGPRYAASTVWAEKIYYYMNEIRAN